MYLDRISAAHSETRLIARDAAARSQWEAVLAATRPAGVTAWPSEPVVSQSQWRVDCWESAQLPGRYQSNRLLLTSGQTEKLWQRVIEASEEGQALISTTGVASWARLARRDLLDSGLPPNRQRGPVWQDDAAAFLRWNAGFENYLNRNGWIDPDSLLFEINQLPASEIGHDLLLLDPPRQTTSGMALLDRWREAGFRIESLHPDDHRGTTTALIANDPRGELECAAAWAAERLQADPQIRLAIVIPDLESRREEIEQVLVDRVGNDRVLPFQSPAIRDIAVFGAALTGIELLSGHANFNILSRWLRSPFFASQDVDRARLTAAVEIALRSDPRSQFDFGQAWQRHGLRTLIQSKLPATGRQIDLALDRLPRRATPTAWTGAWQACLEHLGWQGFESNVPEAMLNAWENAWAAFSELTPILGPIDSVTALDAFGQIVSTQPIYQPLPLQGVHLMNRISQIGPGYQGAWVCGFSDDNYPEPGSANPLLPWSIQAAHGMAGASPDTALAASREELARLLQRVPSAVFSCPARSADQPLMPCPLVAGWQPADNHKPVQRTHTRLGARDWQERIDPAPPYTEPAIPGGTRTLDLQAKAPLKAFCSARLRAEPLAAPARGIDPRLKGLLIHRALELSLAPDRTESVATGLDGVLNQTFGELVKPGNRVWDAQVQAERVRIAGLLRKFVELERGRDPFVIVDVERRTDIGIANHRLRCRIDRIDRLASGGEILIDYKTGQSVGSSWFEPRLGDCQLPIYAQAVAEIAGIVAIRLAGNEIEYRGAGRQELALPGKIRSFDDQAWAMQVDRWRGQLAELIDEFVAGDVRVGTAALQHIDSHAMDHVGGAFAPLSRIGDTT
jgi:probable DNA repair protein